jgi:hypothetical protein
MPEVWGGDASYEHHAVAKRKRIVEFLALPELRQGRTEFREAESNCGRHRER